jgi:hypothetical protein
LAHSNRFLLHFHLCSFCNLLRIATRRVHQRGWPERRATRRDVDQWPRRASRRRRRRRDSHHGGR